MHKESDPLRNNICPYLGLKTDPKTVLEFPSIGNHCHKAMPVAPVNAKHQEKYCLTALYVECPVYKRAEIQRIPTRVADAQVIARRRRFLLTVVLMTVIFSVAAVAVVILRQNPGLIAAPTTQAAGLQEAASATPSPAPTNTLAPSPSLTPSQEPEQTDTPAGAFRPFLPTTDLTRQACPKPEGWVVYIYKSTDSLALLGNYYGISPMELMVANCLTSPAQLSAGDRIFVPGATVTPTPTETLTPTVTNTPRPVVIITRTNTSAPPPPPPPTKTPVPPTNTPVPPTDTPVVPTVPTESGG